MALEIEFEDGDAADGEPAASERVESGASRGRWGAYAQSLPVPAPVPGPRLLLAATAVAVGVTAVAGLDFGRAAQQDRSRAALNLAPADSYTIDTPATGPLPDGAQGDAVERAIQLRVLNDGPRTVTVLGGTLYSPDIAVSRLAPDADGVVRPGGVGTLRTVALVSCGGGVHEGVDATFAEVSFATVADIDLRTADGRVHRVRIVVEQYSTHGTQGSCAAPGHQVLARNR